MNAKVLSFPTKKIFEDLYFDFNLGLRVYSCKNTYRIKMIDSFSGTILLNDVITKGETKYSPFVYFVYWRLQIWSVENERMLYSHDLNLKDRNVLIQLDSDVIGDLISWFTSVNDFQLKHKCKLFFYTKNNQIVELFQKSYTNINFVKESDKNKINFYASYRLLIGDLQNTKTSQFDSRFVGLQMMGCTILGVNKNQQKPIIYLCNEQNKIKQKYVCIATRASSKIKQWNDGKWKDIVLYLKSIGYKVFQIDKNAELVEGCENYIGDIHLLERAKMLKYADFFIGVSSGLSWIAWCINIPVIMICNITYINNQFYTPYRVQSFNCCYGCWHNIMKRYESIMNGNFECNFKNTDRQYECSKSITVLQVKNTIDKLISQNNLKSY